MPKILVVDDEAYIRLLYKKEFEQDGYEVLLAANAEEAMKAVTEQHPQVIILDIELEESNGLDLLNRLRQDYHDCLIVLNTAYSTYKSDFQTWLADAYVMKSSDLNPLKAKIKSLLAEGCCGQEK